MKYQYSGAYSHGAKEARYDGKFPLGTAIVKLKKELKIDKDFALKILLSIGPCEWHHVGFNASKEYFYDVAKIIEIYNKEFGKHS